MQIQPFFIFLVDHDRKVFNILGPLTDDRPWIDRCASASNAGRKVQCFAVPATDAREQLAENYSQADAYRLLEKPIY